MALPTTAHGSLWIAEITTHNTRAAILNAAPIICDTILNISSPFVYEGSVLSLSFVLSIKSVMPFERSFLKQIHHKLDAVLAVIDEYAGLGYAFAHFSEDILWP